MHLMHNQCTEQPTSMHPHTQWQMQSTCMQTSVHIMTCTINTLPWITNMRASVKEQRWPLTFLSYVLCIVHTVSEFTHLTNTLSAPSGVTNVAGANAYAAKFAASPAPTVEQNNNRIIKMYVLLYYLALSDFVFWGCTCKHFTLLQFKQ